jgi:hypothetical protein
MITIYHPFGFGVIQGIMVDFPIVLNVPTGWVEFVFE